MGSLNQVTLVGNLGRDAEIRYTPSGAAVASFSIATSESWTDKASGQKKEQTEWHRIVLWGKSAEALEPYLKKGKSVCVVGRLQTRKWEKDGQTHYSTEIRADRIQLLGGGDGQGRRGRDDDQYGGYAQDQAPATAPVSEDDIPF